MHFVFGQDTSGPLEFSLVLHLGTTPWVMALMTSCPDSGVFFWTLDPPLSILGTTCARKNLERQPGGFAGPFPSISSWLLLVALAHHGDRTPGGPPPSFGVASTLGH